LIRKNTCCRYGVFKVRAGSSPALRDAGRSPVSQSSTACGHPHKPSPALCA
jgi:hypothetical protein